MKKLGLKRLKTYAIPAKWDQEQQEPFKNELEPRLTEATAGQRVVYFADALWMNRRSWRSGAMRARRDRQAQPSIRQRPYAIWRGVQNQGDGTWAKA